ncbi:MAG: hypothetical protein IPN76_21845 [Saprospiraceae bacterium]|nr:hypothetical protein [Saprospiraceae bacterium]
MKLSHLVFLMAFSLLAACSDDDANPSGTTILKYDNDNVSGPLLAAGEHELAVRFPASLLADHVGENLTEVQVFVGNQPAACRIRIYGQGDAFTPGAKKYDADVTNSVATRQWFKHAIATGFEITGEDVWIGIYVEHTVEMNSIGCDAGPRQPNGDWLFSGSDLSWKTYQERTSEGVNWNIRAKIE